MKNCKFKDCWNHYLDESHPSIRLDRIVNAYTDDRMFSIDLVGAVRVLFLLIYLANFDVAGLTPGILRAEDACLVLDRGKIF